MTTIHLQPSVGRQTAALLKQNALTMFDEVQSLRRALRWLEMSWQGGGQEEFMVQANACLRTLERQADDLQILSERLVHEIAEWEQTDQRGASSFGGIGWRTVWQGHFPYTGGGESLPFWEQPLLPLFTAISAIPLLSNLPGWLDAWLTRFLPTPEISSPIAEYPKPAHSKPSSPLGALLQEDASSSAQPSQASPPVQTETAPTAPSPKTASQGVYDIPPKAQGQLYGNRACLPTAMSMVLDYYHAKDPQNVAASPADLIKMLDAGDGTPQTGIGLDKLNDDLSELNYRSNVKVSDMKGLKTTLEKGPVVVNTQVGLLNRPSRDITPNGSYNHAILVKGIGDKSVIVNDPWSGKEKTIPLATFERMWKKGGNYAIVIRPKGR